MLRKVPLDNLVIDELFSHGGMRQRVIQGNSSVLESIRTKGFDPMESFFCVFEQPYTDDEWSKYVEEKKLPAEQQQKPTPLHQVFKDDWDVSRIINLPEQEQWQHRRFILIDGNHRIFALKNLKSGSMQWSGADEGAREPKRGPQQIAELVEEARANAAAKSYSRCHS